MKKLNKLQINSEKIIKNEELISLKGGYENTCTCMCYNWDNELIGSVYPADPLTCNPSCIEHFEHGFGHCS